MEQAGTAIGGYVPDFELPDINGSVHHLARYLEQYQAVCVIFLGNSCPEVLAQIDHLKQLQAEFTEVKLVGINANDAAQSAQDGIEAMQQFAVAQSLNFPYLQDMTQEVALGFGAQRTPHAFLIDQDGILRYSGRVGSGLEADSQKESGYLRLAIAQLLQGESIRQPQTEPVGCLIPWRLAGSA